MTITAVLLAGGKSRRMGQDKATLLFRGSPMWQIQLQLLRELKPTELLVSAQADPPWRPSDAKFVADAEPSCGPISGIAAALSRISNDYLIVLAIDMPFMTESYLRSLCERIEPGRGVVPMIENRAEPLATVYPRDAKAEFHDALSGDDFSLQSLVRTLIAADKLFPIQVSDSEKDLFRNLNEPPDLKPPAIGG